MHPEHRNTLAFRLLGECLRDRGLATTAETVQHPRYTIGFREQCSQLGHDFAAVAKRTFQIRRVEADVIKPARPGAKGIARGRSVDVHSATDASCLHEMAADVSV
ncbi:hypothetical protein CLV63_101265 [Murinocardiopsis flavida]|uniref:Uncharacterized protein n=1 Tax=Murinocardiopsis flavida TaxID=645275 RepID=A0A2P8DU96_9ACTN|nr:hypothetical protein CLV63_101265 [Murinocardiopsis flavida]